MVVTRRVGRFWLEAAIPGNPIAQTIYLSYMRVVAVPQNKFDKTHSFGVITRCAIPQHPSDESAQLFRLHRSVMIEAYTFSWTQSTIRMNPEHFKTLCLFIASTTSLICKDVLSCRDIQNDGQYCFFHSFC